MKYTSPLPPEVLDKFCEKNKIKGFSKYTLEKFAQLDSEMLRTLNNTELGDLYKINRQTVGTHINSFLKSKIILDSIIGKIITLPTYTGFFGVYYGCYEGLYRFVLTLPKTDIHVYTDIYEDEFKRNLHQTLILGVCYYLNSNVKIPSKPIIQNEKDCYHISFLATNCIGLYAIDSIGYYYKNKKFVKKEFK